MAVGGFAAVGAYAVAVVDGVAAGFATRHLAFFSLHPFASAIKLLQGACELSFRKIELPAWRKGFNIPPSEETFRLISQCYSGAVCMLLHEGNNFRPVLRVHFVKEQSE